MEDLVVYCASKYGVRGFTQSLALEFPTLNVCGINPTMTATPLSGFQGRPPEEVAEMVHGAVSGQTSCKAGRDVDTAEDD
jgi:NAD(P)-dependent dehydrogenase (short-subunit alcohol dehydrogenase family)